MTPTQPDRKSPQKQRNGENGTGWFAFRALRGLNKRVVAVVTAVCGAVAVLATLVGNLDNLKSRYDKWHRDSQYQKTLHRPFPTLLTDKDIEKWSSGRLKLALYQIDGYLGRLKTAQPWIKTCLTTEAVFPKNYNSQYNDRLDLDENYIDRENRELILRGIDKIQLDKKEDADIYRTPDPFTRLLKRSSVQLLSDFKDSDISALDKAELYLLRNAIFGQHGYKFDTPKLRKLANRKGWSSAAASFNWDNLSEVEKCNAFFLEQLHPVREAGALGRGILIRSSDSATFLPLLKPWLCTCFGQHKTAIACRESSRESQDEYRDFVDFVLDFRLSDAVRVEWTFLDTRYIVPPDLAEFKENQHRFISAAVDFGAALHQVFRSRSLAVVASQEIHHGSYWGVNVGLSQDALQQLTGDPSFMRETATAVCNGVRDALELTGPFTPRTVDLVAVQPDPAQPALDIFDKPIAFDDLRIKLTREYTARHYHATGPGIDLIPLSIVINWTDTATLDEAYDKFQPSVLPGSKPTADAPDGIVNYSAHYLIDRDGTIFNLMKDFQIARHLPGLDRQALGIACVGSADLPLTPPQAQAAAQLVRYLVKKFGSVKFLIGASEYESFVGSPLWEEKESAVKLTGLGPDGAFLKDLRSRLADVKLRSAP